MRKSKYKIILIILLCIVVVFMSVSMMIMANNVFHTEHCDKADCSLCKVIQLSIDLIRNLDITYFILLLGFINIVLKQYKLKYKTIEYENISLVEWKVIQNR